MNFELKKRKKIKARKQENILSFLKV